MSSISLLLSILFSSSGADLRSLISSSQTPVLEGGSSRPKESATRSRVSSFVDASLFVLGSSAASFCSFLVLPFAVLHISTSSPSSLLYWYTLMYVLFALRRSSLSERREIKTNKLEESSSSIAQTFLHALPRSDVSCRPSLFEDNLEDSGTQKQAFGSSNESWESGRVRSFTREKPNSSSQLTRFLLPFIYPFPALSYS